MIILIDGHSIAFRAFYALPDSLATKDGLQTNAIHGFLMMLNRIVQDYQSEQIIITWDVSKITFRNELYSEYKSNRASSPDTFKEQIKILQKLLFKFNIPQISEEGFEADDVLGSLSKIYNKLNKKVLIVTGDRDSFQLINSKTNILYTKKGISDVEVFEEKNFVEKYKINTNQYVEYLALKGDKSDNIPGLPGVGELTALKLLLEFKNISTIYKNLDNLTSKLQEVFINNKEILFLSKELATIKTNLKIKIPNVKTKDTIFFNDEVFQNAKEDILNYELNKFLTDRKQNLSQEVKLKNLKISKQIEFVKEKSIVFVFENKKYFVNKSKFGEFDSLKIFSKVISLTSQDFALLEGDSLNIDTFTAYDCLVFIQDPSTRPDNLQNIAKYLDKFTEINKKSTIEEYIRFFIENFKNISQNISEFHKNKIFNYVYSKIDFPLLKILSSMEKIGVHVNLSKMKKLSKELTLDLTELKKKSTELSKRDFNLNSPKQLAEVLYVDMKLPVLKKTPKGSPSTDASVLEELATKYELPKIILKYRELEKLRSTYVDGLIPEVTSKNKIHTHYNLFGTATGRLSSEKPNLQNIPNKTELGQSIRDFFISEPGKLFFIADYSQIELRILAHLSGDSEMINILKNETSDIHSETASRIFQIPIKNVTSDMRRKAKEVNFGLIYGMEAFGLAKSLDITQKDASKLIETYFNQFPKIKGFLDEVVSNAEKSTYTTTLFGRIRIIRELSSSNFQVKSMGKRIAMNAPIQGTAADIMKIAMINISNRLNKIEGAKLLLQIHDEIVVEVDEKNIDQVSSMVTDEMSQAADLLVPLYVNTRLANSLANFNK